MKKEMIEKTAEKAREEMDFILDNNPEISMEGAVRFVTEQVGISDSEFTEQVKAMYIESREHEEECRREQFEQEKAEMPELLKQAEAVKEFIENLVKNGEFKDRSYILEEVAYDNYWNKRDTEACEYIDITVGVEDGQWYYYLTNIHDRHPFETPSVDDIFNDLMMLCENITTGFDEAEEEKWEKEEAMPELWKTAKETWEDYENDKMDEDYMIYLSINEYAKYMGISGINYYPTWNTASGVYVEGEFGECYFALGDDEIDCALNIDGCSSAEDFFDNIIEVCADIFEKAEKRNMTDEKVLKEAAELVQDDIDESEICEGEVAYLDRARDENDGLGLAIEAAIREDWDRISGYILEHTDAISIKSDLYLSNGQNILIWEVEAEEDEE